MKTFILFLLITFIFAAPAPRLIKQADNPAVYLIIDGKKSWIPDPAAYNRIIVTSQNKITIVPYTGVYSDGPQLDTNVQLIKGKDAATIYLASYGIKRGISNPDVFNNLGFDWNKVLTVDHYVLQLFITGPVIY